jgi:hypothetical protein
MKLKKLIKKINKENTPPGGWRSRDKVSSSQAGGPSHKESGFKQQAIQETVPYNDIEEAQS